ncbi:polysaccharide deacetylase family protein [Phaeodactylibacter xiamenensis]|uniref:polysaccharide deacetylase family protein n=1 Tax=Phaeodactylibacter xiamenensis TaxID=1524460 RepID=UPI003BAA291F
MERLSQEQNKTKALEVKSVFSVDVEDGVSIAMRDIFNKTVPQTDRVIRTTEVILDLLAKHHTKATFFTLAQVAEAFPALVQRIVSEGHELAVHGNKHLLFSQMTPQLARQELSSAKKKLEDISGQYVIGHRAPAFSISERTPWAIDVLLECGFQYDSSIMPIKASRYGWPGFSENPCLLIGNDNRKLVEVPIKPIKLFGKAFPYSGGSYLRLLPYSLIKTGFSQNPTQSILYIHPYELDTKQYPDYYLAALKKESLWTQLKMRSMWFNRKNTIHKLDDLLSCFRFDTMKNFIKATEQQKTLKKINFRELVARGKNSTL